MTGIKRQHLEEAYPPDGPFAHFHVPDALTAEAEAQIDSEFRDIRQAGLADGWPTS